jgi:hypothetical protein
MWHVEGEVNTHTVLVRKPEGKRPFRRPGCRWEDNIKTDLREVWLKVWIVFIRLRIGTIARFL